MEDVKVTRLINGPEAFTPDNEFCLGETDVRGLFVAAGFCAHGLAGAGGIGKVMAEWIVDRRAVAGRLGDGHPPLRPAVPLARATRWRAPGRSTRPTTTSATRATSARPGGRCEPPARTPGTGTTARRSARSPAGSGSTGTSPMPPAGDASAAPPGLGGDALVAGDRRRGARHPRRRRGCSTSPRSPSSRSSGPGAAELLERLCDNRIAREVGRITYTQMLNRRGGIECDFTVTRVPRTRFQIVTGTAFGNHDAGWIRRHLPHDGSVDPHRCHLALGLLRPLGARVRGRSCAPLTPDPLDFGYMRMREMAVGDVPVRALRVTFVGELGWELYCPTEYGAGLWRTLWEAGRPARPRGRGLSGDRLAAAGEGLPRVGGRHHARRDPAGGRAGVLRARGPLVHRRRRPAASPSGACAAWCSRTRARWRWATSRSASADEICGRVTSGGYGYTVQRSIAYAYLPAEIAVGTEVERRHLRALGRPARSSAEPLLDPERRPDAAISRISPCSSARRRDSIAVSVTWGFLWLMLALKLPLAALIYIVWWAIKQEPEDESSSDDDGGIKRHRPHPPPAVPAPPPAWPARRSGPRSLRPGSARVRARARTVGH